MRYEKESKKNGNEIKLSLKKLSLVVAAQIKSAVKQKQNGYCGMKYTFLLCVLNCVGVWDNL